MQNGCVECNVRPGLHDVVSVYSETFPVKAPDGAQFTLTLRLCLRCGMRFADRSQIREYLRTKLPAYTNVAAGAPAV